MVCIMTKDGITTAADIFRALERLLGVATCRKCKETFWEDDPGIIREPHGSFTEVCPRCGHPEFDIGDV